MPSFLHDPLGLCSLQSSAQDPYHGLIRAGSDSGHYGETSYALDVVESVLGFDAFGMHGLSQHSQATSFHHDMDLKQTTFPTGKLMITAVKARGIKGDEFWSLGKADVYAILTVGGIEVGITQAKTLVNDRGGSDPYWNQTFVFIITEPHRDFSNLNVELYNKNRRLRHDSPLGGFRNEDMAGALEWKENKVPEKWYKLYLKGEPAGEICLGFNFICMTSEEVLHSISNLESDSNRHYQYSSANGGGWGSTTLALGLGVIQAGIGVAALAL